MSRPTYVCFIVYQKAFETIKWHLFWPLEEVASSRTSVWSYSNHLRECFLREGNILEKRNGNFHWTIQTGDRMRIEAYKIWWLKLKIPWTMPRSKISIIRKGNITKRLSNYFYGPILCYFGHIMQGKKHLEWLVVPRNEPSKRRKKPLPISWFDGQNETTCQRSVGEHWKHNLPEGDPRWPRSLSNEVQQMSRRSYNLWIWYLLHYPWTMCC